MWIPHTLQDGTDLIAQNILMITRTHNKRETNIWMWTPWAPQDGTDLIAQSILMTARTHN